MELTITTVNHTIAKIEEDSVEYRETFIPTRYPYTYAYDYMRSHGDYFNLEGMRSRADCAGLLRRNPDKEYIVICLAEAYLREHKIRVPEDFRWEIPEVSDV